jgi:hypothetical protein
MHFEASGLNRSDVCIGRPDSFMNTEFYLPASYWKNSHRATALTPRILRREIPTNNPGSLSDTTKARTGDLLPLFWGARVLVVNYKFWRLRSLHGRSDLHRLAEGTHSPTKQAILQRMSGV